MYVVSGRLIDRFGTRICMTLFAVGWSIANIASGLSHSFSHLAASRVLMGAAEPGAFPVVQRAILNWVPIERRALAIRSEEHTSELQSLMRISYAVFCLKKKTTQITKTH